MAVGGRRRKGHRRDGKDEPNLRIDCAQPLDDPTHVLDDGGMAIVNELVLLGVEDALDRAWADRVNRAIYVRPSFGQSQGEYKDIGLCNRLSKRT